MKNFKSAKATTTMDNNLREEILDSPCKFVLLVVKGFGIKRAHYFGGSGSILSRMRVVSSMTAPTISRLFGLSLSTVS